MSDKTEKPAKAPGALRKPIKKAKFEKRFVKYIEHPQDRQFFTACFNKQEDFYVIKEPLSKADVKKLKNLYKWVKKNRKGAIKMVPLAFAGIVIAAIVIFFTIFANPLLERATEIALESIFEARADVRGFRLSIFKFSISINSITVANRDKPMTNLFEMGHTAIRMKPAAVLRGKIYIEEISADGIRFGTERKVSGAIPLKPAKVKPEKPKSDEPPMVDLKNFDAMALLNEEYDKLSSPKLYDEAVAAYNETYTKWQGQVDDAKKQVADLQTNARPLLNINASSLTDVATITKTVQDITTMVNSVQSAANTATNMVSGIEADINMARNLEQNARNAVINDINHLKSYVDLGSGAAFGALEPYIRDMLSDTAEQYLDYGLIALEAFQKLKAEADAKPKEEKPVKEKKETFKGRDVIFPLRAYPKFYLGLLSSDMTLDAWNGDFKLRDVSSNPDLTGKPVNMTFAISEVTGTLNRNVSFDGSLDLRTNPSEQKLYTALVNGGGFPINIGDYLKKAGINGLSGNSDFSVNLTGYTNNDVSVGGDFKILQARLVNPTGTIAEATDTAIREAGQINLGVQYTHRTNQSDEFKITTNLADLIARALRNAAAAYAQKAMDDIEKALRQRIDKYIEDKFGSKDQVDLLLRTARGDKAAMDQIMGGLDGKKKELEQRATQAAQDALKSNLPSLPSLPSGGGLKLPF